jgi:hypothetical protein
VEELEELACMFYFSGRSHFEDLGSETFQSHFWGIKWHFLGSQIYENSSQSIDYILHTDIFPMVKTSPQLEFVCGSYASSS